MYKRVDMSKFTYLLLIACLLCLISCKKNRLGGKSNIKGKVTHHEKAIPYARVYIKYNAKEFPGEDITVYDTYIDADHNGNFYIEHVYHGDYYFYGIGFDDAIAAPGIVKGGTGLKVKMLKEYTGFVVPVSED